MPIFDRFRDRFRALQEIQLQTLADAARSHDRPDVAEKIEQGMRAIPWAQLIVALMPVIIQLLNGGKIDWQQGLEIIAKLFTQNGVPMDDPTQPAPSAS